MISPTPPERSDRDARVSAGEATPGRPGHAPARLTIADRALLWAQQAWGSAGDSRFWERFEPCWRERLRGAGTEAANGPGSAIETLRRAHAAEARPDPAQVHPSWWVRALKDEAPSVQRALATVADPPLPTVLRGGPGPGSSDLAADHPPHPDALRWVLGLWAERIVGDLPRWPDDPPVVLALSRLDLREVLALSRAAGQAKLALAGLDLGPSQPRAVARFEAFRRAWGEPEPSDRAQARRDYEQFVRSRGRGRGWTRLGLVTFGRLLVPVEPYRTRWALQHLPYALARTIRPTINDREVTLSDREGEILRVAWDRLVAEGRIRAPGDLEA